MLLKRAFGPPVSTPIPSRVAEGPTGFNNLSLPGSLRRGRLDRAVASARAQICFFGHHHARVTPEVAGVPCLGLNIVDRPGNLVAVDVPSSSREPWMLLGEWPATDVPYRPVWPKQNEDPMGLAPAQISRLAWGIN